MKKVILFDLYDTVLKDISFDFDAGLEYLHDAFFKQDCSLDELKAYAQTFLPLYAKRKTDAVEICLIQDEIPLFFEKFGISKNLDFSELDYTIMNQMQKVTLLEEVRYTLDELHKQGIAMYILSNSIFTGKSAKRLLDDFEILPYFKNLFSSADYGIRKPNPKFFQITIDTIRSDYPEVTTKDILYVGNDYVTDVTGATSMGLPTAWYNVNHLPNKDNLSIFDIDDFRKLLEIIHQ